MSNLGFQALYGLFNSIEGVSCERAFLPDKEDLPEYDRTSTKLFSLESQTPLASFDMLAFSISFEEDYLNIPGIMALAGVSLYSAERGEREPLVLAGGAAPSLNPEPVAPFFDVIFIGEGDGGKGENGASQLIEKIKEYGASRDEAALTALTLLDGAYVPALYDVTYDGARIESVKSSPGAPERVRRVRAEGAPLPETVIYTPNTEFSDTHLVEIERGCSMGCRFCAAGFMYLPPRFSSNDALKESVARGVEATGKVGLVGAAVTEHAALKEAIRAGIKAGAEMTLSSLRLDTLDAELLSLLKEAGYKTITLAPEAGTERLRRVVNKDIPDSQIEDAFRMAREAGFKRLKLYFMVGLPTEEDSDALAIGEMALMAKKIMGGGTVKLSLNPFVPKPATPFQWARFEEAKVRDGRYDIIKEIIKDTGGVTMKMLSHRVASIEAYLSRADRRAAAVIEAAAKVGFNRAARKGTPGLYEALYRERAFDEQLPWDIVDDGLYKKYLRKEYERGLSGKVTPPCDVGSCTRCGVC